MRLIAALVALLMLVSGAQAQNAGVSGDVQINLLSVDGLVVGQTMTVDAAFGQEHGLEVPLPFDVLIPTADDIRELVLYAPSGPGGAFFKMTFALDDDTVIENLQFVPMTMGGETMEERLQGTAELLTTQGWAMVVETATDQVQDVVQKTEVSGYEAVEVIGRYVDPEVGLVYTRLVGIPHPDMANINGVLVVANVVASTLELSGPEDFPQTRGGTALKHFQFLE